MSCFASLKDCAAAFKDTAAYSVNPNGYTAIEGLLFWVTRVRSHLASGLDEVPEELAFDCHSAHFLYDVEKVCFHTDASLAPPPPPPPRTRVPTRRHHAPPPLARRHSLAARRSTAWSSGTTCR